MECGSEAKRDNIWTKEICGQVIGPICAGENERTNIYLKIKNKRWRQQLKRKAQKIFTRNHGKC